MTNKGWQCPICERVYSPTVAECQHCNGEKQDAIRIEPKPFPVPERYPYSVPYPAPWRPWQPVPWRPFWYHQNPFNPFYVTSGKTTVDPLTGMGSGSITTKIQLDGKPLAQSVSAHLFDDQRRPN